MNFKEAIDNLSNRLKRESRQNEYGIVSDYCPVSESIFVTMFFDYGQPEQSRFVEFALGKQETKALMRSLQRSLSRYCKAKGQKK